MKYVCLNCKKSFIYAAEQTEEDQQQNVVMRRVCPYCQSLDFEEYVELEPKLVSVISVDIPDVDARLKEGYEVKEIYSKNAVLVKKEKS